MHLIALVVTLLRSFFYPDSRALKGCREEQSKHLIPAHRWTSFLPSMGCMPLFGIVFVVSNIDKCAGQVADIPSIQELSDTYEAQELSLESLYVKYRVTARLIGSKDDVAKYLKVVTLRDNIETFAFKGKMRFYAMERTNNSADVSTNLEPLSNDGKQIRAAANFTYAFDGKTLRNRGAGGQTASIGIGTKEQDDAGYFNPEYMGLTYRVLPDALFPQNTRAENRMTGAIKKGLCKIRPAMEMVEEANCIVVDVTGDLSMTFWCDPAKRYAVRQQVGHRPKSTLLLWRTTCRDFVEVSDGIWFPKSATNERFADASAPSELQNVPLLAYETEVLEIHANDVPDELFTLTIPEGAIITDYTNLVDDGTGNKVARTYSATAGPQRLDQTIQTIRQDRAKGAANRRNTLIAINLGIVLALGVALIARRYLKNRN